jgi:hypothetical protein
MIDIAFALIDNVYLTALAALMIAFIALVVMVYLALFIGRRDPPRDAKTEARKVHYQRWEDRL